MDGWIKWLSYRNVKHRYTLDIEKLTVHTLSDALCSIIHPSIHPSIFYTRLISRSGRGGAGAYPSCHWAKGGVHPGQVASPSQGHTEPNETNNHAHLHLHPGSINNNQLTWQLNIRLAAITHSAVKLRRTYSRGINYACHHLNKTTLNGTKKLNVSDQLLTQIEISSSAVLYTSSLTSATESSCSSRSLQWIHRLTQQMPKKF